MSQGGHIGPNLPTEKAASSARLREEREERGWSREALARHLRRASEEELPAVVSLAHMIKEWEVGKHGLSDRYQLLYCRVFGIPKADLFGGKHRTRRSHLLRQRGLSWEQIADMWEVDYPEVNPRIAFRWAHELTHQEVAERWNSLDPGEPTMSGSRIREFEVWPKRGRAPSPQALMMLAQIYGTTAHRLLNDKEYALYDRYARADIDNKPPRQKETEEFISEVRRLMAVQGLSLRQLARISNYDAGYLSRVLNGYKVPSPQLVRRLDGVLGAEGKLVDIVPVASKKRPLSLPKIPRSVDAHHEESERLQVILSSGDSDKAAHRVPQPATPIIIANGYSAQSDIAVMEGFRVADRQIGGGHLYPAIVGYLKTTIAPRMFEAASSIRGEELFVSASALSEMAGWMAHDAGDDDTAQRHFQRSLDLVTVGEDYQLNAHIFASMSHLSLNGDNPSKAIQLARKGRATLPTARSNPGLTARLFSMEARALAALNQAVECDRVLGLAAQVLGERPTEEPSPWVSNFDEASLASEAARCMNQLSRLAEAEIYARRIIALRAGSHTRSRAFGQLILISVLIAQGNVEEACSIAEEVLAATHSLSSYRVLERLHDLRERLTPFRGDTTVSSFIAQLNDALHVRSAPYRSTDKQHHH